MIITNTKERSRFLRFAVVGIIGAIIDFGVFNICTNLLGIRALYASVISFVLAVCSNFVWNRFWTYPDSRSKHVVHQLVQFLVISLVGLLIRTPTFAFLEKVLIKELELISGQLPFTPVFVGHNLALAIVIILVMFWNFFANRFWTYADVQ